MAQTLVIDGLKNRQLPINLRQSGNSDAHILISTRVRKSPWWHLSKAAGCRAYTTYNHMYHPRAYVKPEDGGLLKEYEYLTEHVSMWGRCGRASDTGQGSRRRGFRGHADHS